MESEVTFEEIVVTGARWYRYLSCEDWVVLASVTAGLIIAFVVWRRHFENRTSLLQKIVLAGVSGGLCYAVFYFGFDGRWPEPLFFFVSGVLFAAGVLFPYLKYDSSVVYRGSGLIATSTLSYWCAIETAARTSRGMFGVDARGFLAASIVGAVIVLTGARFVAPLHRSLPLAVVGFAAAIIGGLAFALTLGQESDLWRLLAFSAWHALMGFAVHIAEGRPLQAARMK